MVKMKKTKQTNIILIVVAVVVVSAIGYLYFQPEDEYPPSGWVYSDSLSYQYLNETYLADEIPFPISATYSIYTKVSDSTKIRLYVELGYDAGFTLEKEGYYDSVSCFVWPDCSPNYDVNNNGVINFQDTGLIWSHRTTDDFAPYNATYDMNCNGAVSIVDSDICWAHRT